MMATRAYVRALPTPSPDIDRVLALTEPRPGGGR